MNYADLLEFWVEALEALKSSAQCTFPIKVTRPGKPRSRQIRFCFHVADAAISWAIYDVLNLAFTQYALVSGSQFCLP